MRGEAIRKYRVSMEVPCSVLPASRMGNMHRYNDHASARFTFSMASSISAVFL